MNELTLLVSKAFSILPCRRTAYTLSGTFVCCSCNTKDHQHKPMPIDSDISEYSQLDSISSCPSPGNPALLHRLLQRDQRDLRRAEVLGSSSRLLLSTLRLRCCVDAGVAQGLRRVYAVDRIQSELPHLRDNRI